MTSGFWAHLLSWARTHLCSERTAVLYFLGARRGKARGSSASYPASHVDCNLLHISVLCTGGYWRAWESTQNLSHWKMWTGFWKTGNRLEVLRNHARFSSPTHPEIFQTSLYFLEPINNVGQLCDYEEWFDIVQTYFCIIFYLKAELSRNFLLLVSHSSGKCCNFSQGTFLWRGLELLIWL